MSVSYKRAMSIDVAQDTSYEELNLHRHEVARSATYAEHSSGTAIVGLASTFIIPMGGVTTANVVYLEVDQPVKVTFNGGAEIIALVPVTGGKAVLWLDSGAWTACSVEVDGISAALLYYMLVGV